MWHSRYAPFPHAHVDDQKEAFSSIPLTIYTFTSILILSYIPSHRPKSSVLVQIHSPQPWASTAHLSPRLHHGRLVLRTPFRYFRTIRLRRSLRSASSRRRCQSSKRLLSRSEWYWPWCCQWPGRLCSCHSEEVGQLGWVLQPPQSGPPKEYEVGTHVTSTDHLYASIRLLKPQRLRLTVHRRGFNFVAMVVGKSTHYRWSRSDPTHQKQLGELTGLAQASPGLESLHLSIPSSRPSCTNRNRSLHLVSTGAGQCRLKVSVRVSQSGPHGGWTCH